MPDQSIRTRASLLERLKDPSDQASWQEFYQTYRELIYSVARRAGLNENEADEVVQAALISVARKCQGSLTTPRKTRSKAGCSRSPVGASVTSFRDERGGSQDTGRHSPGSRSKARTATIERIPDPRGQT
jgi:hypothetical protein